VTTKHILKPFDKDLGLVHEKVLGMAEMVYRELTDCLQAFSDRDQEAAADAKAADFLINDSERIIDKLVVNTIVLHQPMASDCRQLIAALRIARELERIGDYATNISNHSTTLDQLKITGEEQGVSDMGQAVERMMRDVIEAFSNQDASAAESIRQHDEEIDKQYTQLFTNLIAINKSNVELACACTHLIFIARSLERIGDHITDIAEEILFVVNGDFPVDDRSKADTSAFIKG
jgi:phosphate transport system protein